MLSDNEMLWEQVQRLRRLLGEHKSELRSATDELATAKATIKEKETEIKVLRKERENAQDKQLNQRLEAIQQKKPEICSPNPKTLTNKF